MEMYRIQDEEIVGVSRADACRRQGFSLSIPNQSLSVVLSLLTTSAEALPVTWAYLDTQLGPATLGLGRLTLFGRPTVDAVTSLPS